MPHNPGGLITRRYLNAIRPAGGTLIPPETSVIWDIANPGADRYTYSDGDQTATFGAGPAHGVTSVISATSHNSGKRYIEIDQTISAYFGLGVREDVGLTTSFPLLFGGSGVDPVNGIGLRQKQNIFRAGANLGNLIAAGPVGALITVCVAVDIDTGRIWFRVNGGSWGGGAFAVGDPATDTNPIATLAPGSTLYPFASYEDGVEPTVSTVHGNSANIAYPVPSGFSVWGAP